VGEFEQNMNGDGYKMVGKWKNSIYQTNKNDVAIHISHKLMWQGFSSHFLIMLHTTVSSHLVFQF
jgi:hypothetical protein